MGAPRAAPGAGASRYSLTSHLISAVIFAAIIISSSYRQHSSPSRKHWIDRVSVRGRRFNSATLSSVVCLHKSWTTLYAPRTFALLVGATPFDERSGLFSHFSLDSFRAIFPFCLYLVIPQRLKYAFYFSFTCLPP